VQHTTHHECGVPLIRMNIRVYVQRVGPRLRNMMVCVRILHHTLIQVIVDVDIVLIRGALGTFYTPDVPPNLLGRVALVSSAVESLY
jgi:hypothetical protein